MKQSILQLRNGPMALSNAERQQQFRDARKKELKTLRARSQRTNQDGDGLYAFIKQLAEEIYRRRKENNEKRQAIKWNPDNILKVEQKHLLDWIEAELASVLSTTDAPESDRSRIARYVTEMKAKKAKKAALGFKPRG